MRGGSVSRTQAPIPEFEGTGDDSTIDTTGEEQAIMDGVALDRAWELIADFLHDNDLESTPDDIVVAGSTLRFVLSSGADGGGEPPGTLTMLRNIVEEYRAEMLKDDPDARPDYAFGGSKAPPGEARIGTGKRNSRRRGTGGKGTKGKAAKGKGTKGKAAKGKGRTRRKK